MNIMNILIFLADRRPQPDHSHNHMYKKSNKKDYRIRKYQLHNHDNVKSRKEHQIHLRSTLSQGTKPWFLNNWRTCSH